MRKPLLLGLIICFFISLSINAQNHLEPDRGVFTMHPSSLVNDGQYLDILFHDLSERPIVRIIVSPTFENPYVLSLEKDTSSYWNDILIYQKPYYKGEELKYERIQKEIDSGDAELIKKLIEVAVMTTKYLRNNDVIYIDGTRYNFVCGVKSGNLHSGTEGKEMRELISIVDELTQIVIKSVSLDEDEEIELEKPFVKRIEKLTKKLQ